jgi:hypothetical protein
VRSSCTWQVARSSRLLVSEVFILLFVRLGRKFTTRALSSANEGLFELPTFGLVTSNGLPANAIAWRHKLSPLWVLSQSSMMVSIPPALMFCIHHIQQTSRTPSISGLRGLLYPQREPMLVSLVGRYSISHASTSEG